MTKKMTLEVLAGMVKRGFDATATKEDIRALEQKVGTLEQRVDTLDQKVDTLDQKVDTLDQKVDAGFQHVNARLDLLRNDISDLPAIRRELRDLGHRVDRLEQKTKR